jgi:hypothetical protein
MTGGTNVASTSTSTTKSGEVSGLGVPDISPWAESRRTTATIASGDAPSGLQSSNTPTTGRSGSPRGVPAGSAGPGRAGEEQAAEHGQAEHEDGNDRPRPAGGRGVAWGSCVSGSGCVMRVGA